MLRLRVVQAEFGDCLILEYGTPAQWRFMLIDGGPPDVYERHLRGELQASRPAAGASMPSWLATSTTTTSWASLRLSLRCAPRAPTAFR